MFWTAGGKEVGDTRVRVHFDIEDMNYKPWCLQISNKAGEVQMFLEPKEMGLMLHSIMKKIPSPDLEELFQNLREELNLRDRDNISKELP